MARQMSIVGSFVLPFLVFLVWPLGLLGVGGCAAQDPTPTPTPSPSMPVQSVAPGTPDAPTTTRVYLAEPRTFRVAPASSADVTASRVSGGDADDQISTVLLPTADGTITLQVKDDGTLAVTALDLELGRITVPSDVFPPEGLDLESLKLSLGAETDATADWSADASTMNGLATTELLLDWSIQEAGVTLPLATEHIGKVTVEIAVSQAQDGNVVVDLHADRDGVFWTWADLLDLSDLHVDLRAAP